MLHKVEPYETCGYPNSKSVKELVHKPGCLPDTVKRLAFIVCIARQSWSISIVCIRAGYTFHSWYSWKYVYGMKLIYYLFYLIMDEIMVTLWSISSRSSLKRYSRHVKILFPHTVTLLRRISHALKVIMNRKTQEEGLALVRTHQMPRNKWAELTKLSSRRTDNAIKDH